MVRRSGVYFQKAPASPSSRGKKKKKERRRKKEKKIRLQQHLAWIKVTRPQILARLCLREVRQAEEGGPCDGRNSLRAHPQFGFQVQHLGQPHSSFPASSPAFPFPYFGEERSPPAPFGLSGQYLESGGSDTRGRKPSRRGPSRLPTLPPQTPPLFP